MTELERLRTILEMLERIGDMFDEALIDDWRRRRVEDAIATCRHAAEHELGIVERQLVKALHPTYKAHP
jgi:hypothetical protein